MFLASGGGVVGSAQITDGSIIDADINASAAIALSKLSGLIGAPGSFISIESTANASHSLTTDGTTQVLVIAFFELSGTNNDLTIGLLYNGVTKMSRAVDLTTAHTNQSFTLGYTETPAAGTHNISIDPSLGSIDSSLIVVVKLKTS